MSLSTLSVTVQEAGKGFSRAEIQDGLLWYSTPKVMMDDDWVLREEPIEMNMIPKAAKTNRVEIALGYGL